ncbi:MAG: efflux RND transporter permease subunit, partial [Rhodospirillaceae bacterium]
MDLIRLSIERPIAVMAAILMLILFGIVALTVIPIQLTPDIRKPVISIETVWPSAAPAEIEREISVKQEEVLKGIEGLQEIRSESQDGRSRINLEFAIGTNMDKALLLTSNRLDRVSGYPDEADEPSIRTAGADDNPIAWFVILRREGNNEEIHRFGDFAEEVIQDRIERVPGVARVNLYGAAKREMTVLVEPEAMARYGLTVSEVINKLRAANSSVSAGDVDEGKRRYIVRTQGEFSSLDDVAQVILRSNRDPATGRFARVTVGDIATIQWDTSKPTERIRFNGRPAMAFNAVREDGANVIEVMAGIREAIAELNEFQVPSQALELRQVYDETVYINSSIDLVQQNIVVGGALAALMLLLFLRSGGATLIVSMAIPVSVIGAFVAMAGMGRSLNVISLAGIAFAVGMVVDAAIVVLENIFRHRELGRSRAEAAYRGAKQVWVAVLVSALTTVMAFIPILVMQLEAGQLFRDIAVALSVSVLISLLVAITLIPALANRILGSPGEDNIVRRKLPVIDNFAGLFVGSIMRLTEWVTRSRVRAIAAVGLLCGVCSAITWVLLPKLEYLPSGNRNLIIGFIVPPPGYNLDTMVDIAKGYERQVLPLLVEVSGDGPDAEGRPKLNRIFFVTFRGRTILGAAAHDPARVKDVIPILRRAAFNEPGTLGIITQRSLFGRGLTGTRTIELNVLAPELEPLMETAMKTFIMVNKEFPRDQGNQVRPQPELVLGAPEVRIRPNRVKLADNGVTARELSDTIDAFNDGLRIAEISVGNKLVDLMIKGPLDRVTQTQGIDNLPVVTAAG